MKEEIKTKLDTAYQKLMTIPVAGVYVEPMAAALSLMREVYKDIDTLTKESEVKKDGQKDRG